MGESENIVYCFGPFRVVPKQRRLERDGEPVPIPAKALDTLIALLKRPGCLVQKSDLMNEVWPDSNVEELSLAQNISMLRKTLGQTEDGVVFIETVPKYGYRFVAAVERSSEALAPGPRPSEAAIPQAAASLAKSWESPPGRTTPGARRLTLGLALLLMIAIAGFGIQLTRTRVNSVPQQISSVVVLPFEDLSPARDQEFVVDGFTDELITALGQTDLKVISRNTSRKLKDRRAAPSEIARSLNVDGMLEGSIRKEGLRLRISVQLTQAHTGYQVWSQSYDRESTNLLVAQEEIATEIVRNVSALAGGQAVPRVVRIGTHDMPAYNAYLKGRYFHGKQTRQALDLAIEYFEEALGRDPEFAAAYAGLADTYIDSVKHAYRSPPEMMAKAIEAIRKALALDDHSAEFHASYGAYKAIQYYDWKGAERDFRRAIQLNPSYDVAHYLYSMLYLAPLGRLNEAEAESRISVALDPLSQYFEAGLGVVLSLQGKGAEALAHLQNAVELDSSYCFAHALLGAEYHRQARNELAVISFKRAQELCPRDPQFSARLANLYGRLGKREQALSLQHQLGQFRSPDVYVSPLMYAMVEAGLGNRNAAIQHLWEAYEERHILIAYIKTLYMFDSLKDDPRYQQLLRRMHLN